MHDSLDFAHESPLMSLNSFGKEKMACLISIAQVLMFCYVPLATVCVLVNYVRQVHKHVFNIHLFLCSKYHSMNAHQRATIEEKGSIEK